MTMNPVTWINLPLMIYKQRDPPMYHARIRLQIAGPTYIYMGALIYTVLFLLLASFNLTLQCKVAVHWALALVSCHGKVTCSCRIHSSSITLRLLLPACHSKGHVYKKGTCCFLRCHYHSNPYSIDLQVNYISFCFFSLNFPLICDVCKAAKPHDIAILLCGCENR